MFGVDMGGMMVVNTPARGPFGRVAAGVSLLTGYIRSSGFNAALVFLVGIAAMSRFTNMAWASYSGDAYTMQYDALRVASGAVPYRDFFSFPGPGTLWLEALVFRVFGPVSLYGVYLLIGTLALVGAELYLLASAISGQWLLSWFAPLFLFFGLAPHWPYPYHEWFAAPFAVLAVLLVVDWLRLGGSLRLSGAGGAAAITGLFLQTEGITLIGVFAVFLVLQTFVATPGLRAGVDRLWPRLTALAAGALAIAIPITIYFAVVGGLKAYLYDTLVWPALHYGCRQTHCINNIGFLIDLPVWPFWGLAGGHWAAFMAHPWRVIGGTITTVAIALAPPFVVLGTVGMLIARIQRVRGKRSVPVQREALTFCGFVVLALLAAFAVSVNLATLHFMWLTLLAYPMLVGFVACIGDNRIARYARVCLAGIAIASGVWYAQFSDPGATANVDTAVKSLAIIGYIRQHTTPSDTIVAMPYGGLLYFHSRDAGIGYTLVLPDKFSDVVLPPGGFHTTAQFREMADQIERNRPKLIIFYPYPVVAANAVPGDDGRWDTKYFASFPPDLGAFVGENYLPEDVPADGATYHVYVRHL